jgi:ACS family tartrate transporter-like MFS transporter
MSDEALERTTLAKAARRLLPLISLGYGVAYMDRVNISFAATQMNHDLNFSAAAYGLGGGLFFVSYALLEVPSNLLLVRFGARRWLARIMFTWGLLAVGMMFVRTPMQFYLMRFLLGAAEAGFFPGVIYYLTLWFPAQHRGKAISRFYIAWPLSSVVMGGLAGALLSLQGHLGLAGWQWLFLVEGLPAVAMAAVFLWLLPDGPAKAPWLSAREKDWLVRRLASDAAALGGPQDHNVLRQLANPLVLTLGAVNFLVLGSFYALTLSAPGLLDAATHLGPTKVGYLVAAGGLAGAVAMLANGWHSDHVRERYIHLAAPLLITAGAFAVLSMASAPLVVMAAYVVGVAAYAGVSGVIWLIPGERLNPRSTAVGVAAINSIGQVGSFIAPYAWGLARDATGSFHAGLVALPVPFALAAGIVLMLQPRKLRVVGAA